MSHADETARAKERLGAVINGVWTLEHVLDVSDLTTTFAARHADGSTAALAILQPMFCGDDEIHEHFLRQSYIANGVEQRGIVAVFGDDITEDGEPFIITELVEGQSVEELLHERGPKLPPLVAISIGEQATAVLAALHGASIFHHALSPARLFITNEGVVKVLEPGGAQLRTALARSARAPWGNLLFMAPEVAMHNAPDGRADVFSMGAVLFNMLAGEPPRRARTEVDALALAVSRPPPQLSAVLPDVDPAVAEVIDRALAWSPAERFQTTAEMHEALLQLLDHLGGEVADGEARSDEQALDDGWDAPEDRAALNPPVSLEPPTLPREVENRFQRVSDPDFTETPSESSISRAHGATAEGTLGDTPLPHLLVYMLDQGLSGTVVLRGPNGATHAVAFDRGTPVKVRTGAPVAPLDSILVELGLVDANTLRDTLAESSAMKELHGSVLVGRKLLDPKTLLEVLRVQTARKLASLFDLPPASTFSFYADRNLITRYGGPEPLPVDTYHAIVAGLRAFPQHAPIEETLGRFGDAPVALASSAEHARFQFDGHEQVALDALRARRLPIIEILRERHAVPEAIRRAVYVLAITRCLDVGAPTNPPVGIGAGIPPLADLRSVRPRRARPAAPPPPPRKKPPAPSFVDVIAPSPTPPVVTPTPAAVSPTPSPVIAAPIKEQPHRAPSVKRSLTPSPEAIRRADIEKRIESSQNDDFFALLGVAKNATREQIQAAYFTAARTFHPDRLPADMVDLKPAVSRAFARINEAYQVLGDVEKRKAYEKSLTQGPPPPDEHEQVAKAMNAAVDFQKAELLLKRNDLPGAEALVMRAAQADPEQPEYMALLTWIQALKRGDPPHIPEGGASAHYDDLIRTFDKILAKEPTFERALFYRGTLLKRAGYADKAFRDFRTVAEINPKNIDAIREVRLHEMRRRESGKHKTPTPPTAGGGGGLFGKFLKR